MKLKPGTIVRNKIIRDGKIVKLKLTQNKWTIIDAGDYDAIRSHRWHAHNVHGIWYASTNIRTSGGQKNITLHRFIMNFPDGLQIDHINGDGLLNTRSNIRTCTYSGNNHNCKKPKHGLSSKFKGVSRSKMSNKWRAYIRVNKKLIHLGYHDKEIDAAKSYNDAAIKYFKEFSKINTID